MSRSPLIISPVLIACIQSNIAKRFHLELGVSDVFAIETFTSVRILTSVFAVLRGTHVRD